MMRITEDNQFNVGDRVVVRLTVRSMCDLGLCISKICVQQALTNRPSLGNKLAVGDIL